VGGREFLDGVVRDGVGPVEGAQVRFRGAAGFVVSGADGRFRLPRHEKTSARVVAAKQGYFIAGASANVTPIALTLTCLPVEDYDGYHWVEPAADPPRRHNCATCHGAIYDEWAASGHARAATNRRFLNLYDGSDWNGRPGVGWNLLAEHPDGAGVCTACHAPTVRFDDPAYFDLRKARGAAKDGVHCDYCHKIVGAPVANVGLTHGRFGLELLRPTAGQLFFGPLADVDRGEDAFSPLYRESRYCASCHEGTVFGVHVYGTYTEWLQSPARREGKHCQTCHMAPTGALGNLAPANGGLKRDPWTLANHRFFAGSQGAMLRQCMKVSVRLTPGQDGLHVAVGIRADGAGHSVPTGFADRNLLLVLEALDIKGGVLAAQTGPLLPGPAGEGFAGRPGRLYAKLLTGYDGHSPVPFWRARPEIRDTRLKPGSADHAVFTFPAGAERVRVRLLYRRFWPDVSRVKGWPDAEITVVDQTMLVRSGQTTRWSSLGAGGSE
jgi:hypothetical protein